ncbi:MAG: phospholipid carrier-dependent glycosyltransferase [Solirubrobacteraceae bacterium]
MCTVAPVMVTRTSPPRPASGLSALIKRLLASSRAPVLGLVIVSILSLGARSLLLDEPCQSPCTHAGQHTLIFDEAYYVNAARVIAGLRPPAGAHYADAPLGTDPNAEHPQGAKLVMAAAIDLFGDGPFAWRIGSLLFGSVAILWMWGLVRAAGGGPWTALCAATLMAADNLLLVHGRIGTLDIYVIAAMICGVALYVRGQPLVAGLALAIAYCFKEVGPYALVVLALLEIGRVVIARRDRASPPEWGWRPAGRRLFLTAFTSIGVFLGLLGIMDEIAPPYADSEAKLITGGPFDHVWHMITYAAGLTSPHGPQGIASYPWQWLLDLKPITYLRINPSLPGDGLFAIHPVSAFFGMMSPAIMAVGIPGLLFCGYRILRGRPRAAPASPAMSGVTGPRSYANVQLALLAVAWFLGTWLPFEFQSAVDSRTSYIYYMVIVMPGIYLAASYTVSAGWRTRRAWLRGLILVWGLSVLVAVVLMYPFVAAF